MPKYIVWKFYDYEGWWPTEYDSLKKARKENNFDEDCILTKKIEDKKREVKND